MPTEFICIPPIRICNRNPSFLIADSIYWVTRTLWLNLLKSNAATRGWLTVFQTDMEAQGAYGQPVAPLIVA
nr:MAG TPA: hypothetical protein [Caudoviricetes sp.]